MLPIAEFGSGAPLIIVPGIQGRWEYVRPAVEALAAHFRVITFALAGDPASGLPFDKARGLDNYAEQIATVMGERGLERAAVCGISFGGLGALRFAASAPGRVSALVLVSTPGPQWRQSRRHKIYTRFPRVCMPLFVGETPLRLRRELARSIPSVRARMTFSIGQMTTLLRAPISVARLAERGRILDHLDVGADGPCVSAPTLIVTGDRALDRIVPVDGTLRYASAIAGAQTATLDDTGHLGCVTRPLPFARIVRAFLEKRDHAAA